MLVTSKYDAVVSLSRLYFDLHPEKPKKKKRVPGKAIASFFNKNMILTSIIRRTRNIPQFPPKHDIHSGPPN